MWGSPSHSWKRESPCLVEKPIAPSIEEAKIIAHHPHLFVGHSERFNPALIPVADVRPRYMEAERLSPFRARSTDIDVVADLMIHDLDLARHFMGTTVTDVRAVGVGVVSGNTDIARARIELGKSVASLSASRVSREPIRRLRLFEDGIYWSVDLLKNRITRVRWGEQESEVENQFLFRPETPFYENTNPFSSSFGDRHPPRCPEQMRWKYCLCPNRFVRQSIPLNFTAEHKIMVQGTFHLVGRPNADMGADFT